MPIVRVTPHEEKHAGFSYMRSQSTTTPNMYPLVTLRWGGGEEGQENLLNHAAPHKQNHRAGYGNVFGALGELGLIVYSIPWGILMNGKNSH